MESPLRVLPSSDLIARSEYVKKLRPDLPEAAFAPSRSRTLVMPVCIAIVALAITAIAKHWVPWFVVPLLSLVIGGTFSIATFIGHEAGHGGILRSKLGKQILGWFGFLPFTISPRLWASWHDRIHHATANIPADPDMYPTLAEYNESRAIRFVVNAFSLGGRRWRGGLSLILGFTVQSANQLIAAREKFLDKAGFRVALAETFAGVALWATVAWLVGPLAFVFAYVIPLVIANIIVMSFILTNHALSPRVEINDPLVSGLSVTSPKWVEWLTLGFGYHVEHHLFPAMSSRHAPAVRDLLMTHWPERYQTMPHGKALWALHSTGRIYKDATTLVDPMTGTEYPTLMPG